MDNSPDLLRAFLMGTRMTMQEYRLVEPSLGENKALGLLFREAASSEPSRYDRQLAKRIVDIIQDALPEAAHTPVESVAAHG